MGNRFHEQTGEQILAGLKQHLADTAMTIRGNTGRLDLPKEYRRKVRNDAIADAKLADQEARQAFSAWAAKTVRAANVALAADAIGSQAEETAKLRHQQLVSHLIETARLKDERDGPKNVGGRIIRDSAARALAVEAQRIYIETTNYEAALAHAEAAIALGVDASRVKDYAQTQIWSSDPVKSQALDDLALVERASVIFEARASDALSHALKAAAAEAKDAGDYDGSFLKDAIGPSMRAKTAAIAVAALTGQPYETPTGALASAPGETSA